MIYIIKPDGHKREIEFEELNQLKKDILWIYDENYLQINCAFVPDYSFKLNYYEYLTLAEEGNNHQGEFDFYKTGSLIIILCKCVEYIDTAGGNQKVFNKSKFPLIEKYIKNYIPIDEPEKNLQSKILLGIQIAKSYTDEQLLDADFQHKSTEKFFENINSIGNDFIAAYFRKKLG